MPVIYVLLAQMLPEPEILRDKLKISVGEKANLWQSRAIANPIAKTHAQESIAGLLLLQQALIRNGIWNENHSYQLCQTTSGRPFLDGLKLDFNISHSGGVVACALECSGNSPRVGIDVECLRGGLTPAMERLAKRWFTAEEQALLQANATEDCFLRIWTGKEALIKFSGTGLSGLSGADTSSLSPADGKCLTSYRLPEAILSVCHRVGAVPGELHFLSIQDLLS